MAFSDGVVRFTDAWLSIKNRAENSSPGILKVKILIISYFRENFSAKNRFWDILNRLENIT